MALRHLLDPNRRQLREINQQADALISSAWRFPDLIVAPKVAKMVFEMIYDEEYRKAVDLAGFGAAIYVNADDLAVRKLLYYCQIYDGDLVMPANFERVRQTLRTVLHRIEPARINPHTLRHLMFLGYADDELDHISGGLFTHYNCGALNEHDIIPPDHDDVIQLTSSNASAIRKLDFFDLRTEETPREILEADFPRLGELPIKGGWGYDKETACIIDRNDPCVDASVPFDGVAIEYVFAEYRIYEELIVFRPKGEIYAGIKFKLAEQRTLKIEQRYYDKMTFNVTAFRKPDFDHLKALYDGPNGISDPLFGAEAHETLHNSLIRSSDREYWFDITSFYGQN